MKAKSISRRLPQFMAVWMAMILIVSCTAIPVAIGEASNATDSLEENKMELSTTEEVEESSVLL